MGKKTRAASGRRPILQLSPPGPRAAAVRDETGSGSDEDVDSQKGLVPPAAAMVTEAPAAVVKPIGGLCLLGAYTDSDDEDGDTTDKAVAVPNTKGNTSADIDSTLANFMAEIDAITAPEGNSVSTSVVPPPTPPKPDPKDSHGSTSAAHNGSDPSAAGDIWHYDTQCSLAGVGVDMGDWQEVWDENTGCYYYWSTQSNEVTWELPPSLVAQVQGAQGHGGRIKAPAVSGAAATESLPAVKEEATAVPAVSCVGSVPVLLKREAKKEVNEAIQALSNKEEEKLGVAASLLAPLLPDDVKEEEERWRKKVICKEDLVEAASEDEEDMVTVCADGEAAADDQAQDDICSTVQSGESEEEAEEPDTLELERVLERRKAELRALEEGDVSVSGSSPRSDFSQTDETQKTKPPASKWKVFVPVASPSSSSSKTGRESPETEMGAEAAECPPPPKEPESECVKTKPPPKPAPDEEEDLKFQIGELANNLISKLEFLGINRQNVSNFHVLLFQTETRISDWREGALSGSYLKRKLQDASEQIKLYEINATPKGWSCHWDRDHRRYFYVNEISGESQWEFPDVEEDESAPKNKSEAAAKLAERDKIPGAPALPPDPPASTPVAATVPVSHYWEFVQPPPLPLEAPLPPPPPPPDSPPPPPPPPPPPSSPPPTPPMEDCEIQEVEMEDEDCEEPPVPGTEAMLVNSEVSAAKAKAEPSAKGAKRKAAADVFGEQSVTIGSCPVLYTQQSISAAPVLAAMSVPSSYMGLPLQVPSPVMMSSIDYVMPSASMVPSVQHALPHTSMATPTLPELQVSATHIQAPASKPPPLEKPKKSKKLKVKKSKVKMPSLVQKWQNIQKELDEEENSSSSDDDRSVLNQKRIDEWKLQQLSSGMAEKNANFEILPEDWRQRLKRRKMTSSTTT